MRQAKKQQSPAGPLPAQPCGNMFSCVASTEIWMQHLWSPCRHPMQSLHVDSLRQLSGSKPPPWGSLSARRHMWLLVSMLFKLEFQTNL